MSITSINTNQAALVAQLNIGNANTNTSNYVTALSSGNRIVNASTDVAALSTGTALQSQVNTLNTALTVASQGSSLLQVADGALNQIQSILQRQQAIATSAQSGSLSDTQRGFLDQEFQTLTQQVDQLAKNTNFNGVSLLDGSISQSLTSTVSTGLSNAASGSYTVTTNAGNNDTLKINGQNITFKSTATVGNVTIGSDINSTVSNLVSFINNAASNTNLSAAQKAAFSAVSATQVGTSGTFSITARDGGSLGGAITLGAAGGGTLAVTSTGQGTGSVQQFTGITTASTTTALTSVTTGGFLSGGNLAYNGTTLKDSSGSNIAISNSTTLQSLVAQVNSGTSTTGVSAFITGSSSNYTLNLANATSSGVTATSAANSSALGLSGSAAISGPIALSGYAAHAQTITFAGITSASTVLTEGNSGLRNGAFGLTTQTAATVTLGTTTISSLATALAAANSGSTAVVGADGSGNVTLTITDTNATAGLTGTSYANYTGAQSNGPSIGSVAYNTTASLAGGQDLGIGYGSTTAVGTALDNVLTAQNQQPASSKIVFPSIQPGDLNSTSNFGGSTPVSITVGSGASAATFNFTTNANSSSATEIQIGGNLQQTLANAVAKINSFSGTGKQNYVFNQLTATSDGNSITIAGKSTGTIYQNDQSTAVTVSASGASSSVTAATLNNSSSGGVDVSTINNTKFTGTISGITATANGTADQVNLSVKIGDITYAASNVSTNPVSANSKVQLISTDSAGAGGYFTIELQKLDGQKVNNQTDANSFASRLNTAVSGLTFFQTRQVSSYNPAASGSAILSNGVSIGSLNGSSISITSNDFTNTKFSGVTVNAPVGGNTNGQITFTANGQNYVSDANIGTSLNANNTYTFTSATDPNQKISFKTGSTSIDFSTGAKALAVQNAITSAFGSSGAAISFQVGSDSTQNIGVSIGSATSSTLFSGQTLDVKTLADATAAGTALTTALNTVTSLRATVGALEERFNYASNAIQNAVQNEGAAKSNLLDTDVSSTSTSFATSQVQLQAGIAVLAQANQLQQNLLKLIQ